MRARTETEEIRTNLQQDIHDLQNKLQLAEITLATSRQQQQMAPPPPAPPVIETKPPIPPTAPINTHIPPNPYPIQPREQHVGMVSLPSMPVVGPQQMMAPQVAPYYAANAGTYINPR